MSDIDALLSQPSITISAPPNTDIWRKPTHPTPTTAFSAPAILKFTRISIFKRCRVTVSAPWSRRYDQGGIIITFNDDEGPSSSSSVTHTDGKIQNSAEEGLHIYSNEHNPKRWIKTGIELVDGTPYISTVSCDRWADWSMLPNPTPSPNAISLAPQPPQPPPPQPSGDDDDGDVVVEDVKWSSVTIEAERDKTALWVYYLQPGGKRVFTRKVTWAFEDAGSGCKMGIGLYACRPTKVSEQDGEELEVKFEGWRLETELV